MAIEFGERIRRIPAYPLAAGYDLGADVAMLASNESLLRALAEVVEAAQRGARRRAPLPGPVLPAAARRLSDRYGIPRQRIALGNGSCDILLAAGEALLEPGAEVVYAWPAFSVYPHLAAASGARAIEVPLDSEDRHDLDAMAAEITVATRLVLICNPNNPTSTSLGLDAIEAFLDRVPAPRVRDPRRGLLRVRAGAGRHRTRRSSCCGAGPTWCCCGRSPRSTGWPGCASATGCAAPTDFRAAVDQVRQPFYLNIAAQAAAVEALRHQDEVERRVDPHGRRADRGHRRPARARAVGRRVRRQLRLDAPARGRGRGRRRRRAARARRAGPRRRRARARGLAAGDGRDRRREPAFPGRHGELVWRRPRPSNADCACHSRTPSGTTGRQRMTSHDPHAVCHTEAASGWSFYARFYAWRFS